jgi:hypothetical protein
MKRALAKQREPQNIEPQIAKCRSEASRAAPSAFCNLRFDILRFLILIKRAFTLGVTGEQAVPPLNQEREFLGEARL